ncbi:MAG TPA: glycosyltransferase family 4 protein [Burkholderiales bacterium]|nr:glycosyltransferase family 4 protein [Burkholderiales bacterium]
MINDHGGRKRLCVIRRQSGGVGGAERAAARYARAFEADWDVLALSAASTGLGVTGQRGPGWWRNWSFARSATQALARLQPDLSLSLERGVVCDIYRAGEMVHSRWARMKHPHYGWVTNLLHWVMPWLERRTIETAIAVVANSEFVRREYAAFYPACAAKMRVIRPGFDPAKYQPTVQTRAAIRTSLGLPDARPLLLFVGSGWHIKGLDVALEVLARLRTDSRWAEAHLAVVGHGRPRRYARLMQKLGVADAVSFVGSVDDTVRFYQAADVLLLPSRFDAFANVCLESLACGCPVVTTDTNGAAELVCAESGVVLHVPYGASFPDESSWMRLLAFLSRPLPAPAAVAATVHGQTLSNELNQYRQLFSEVLAAKQRGANVLQLRSGGAHG